tara:strand:- start:145 stop:456 length:312 start_codon:yes stop_codon:yes gene_type:complete
MKVLHFDKKVDVLGKKTLLPKMLNILGMIGVILLEVIGTIILIFDALYENSVPEQITNFIYILYLLFLVVVTFLYHPPNTHMIPFLSNVTTFGGLLYIYFDRV